MNKIYKVLLGIGVVAVLAGAYLYPQVKKESPLLSGLSVGWERFVSGTSGAIRTLNANDNVLIRGSIMTGTTTSAKLEVFGGIQATATSTGSVSDFANQGGMLDASLFPGVDIGAKINAAYAACSSKGCRIFIPQNPVNGGEWNYTTPISISTHFKPALLYCASGGGGTSFSLGGGTVLNYTPSTGDAITFNTNEYVIAGTGIENCDIHGPSGSTASATRGVVVGGANGGFSFTLKGVTISGFGTGIYLGQNTSFFSLLDSVVNFNGRLISEPDTSGANCENMRISNSVLADANNQAGGATDLFGIYIQESGNCQWNVTQTSIDDAQWFSDQFGGTNNSHTFTNVHWENPNLHIFDFISTLTNSPATKINLIGGDMMNDVVAGMTEMISSGSHVTLSGGFSANNNNNVVTPVTRVVNLRDAASTNSVTWTGLQSSTIGATYVYGTIPFSSQGYGTGLGNPYSYITPLGAVGVGGFSFSLFTTGSQYNPTIGNLFISTSSSVTTNDKFPELDLHQSSQTTGANSIIGFSALNTTASNVMYASIVGLPAARTSSLLAGDLLFFTRILNGSNTERLRINSVGNVGIGTSTTLATFQVSTSTANATTSIQFGKANQNKGTCNTYYDTAGSPVYMFFAAGASTPTYQNGGTTPSGCQN